MLQKYQRWVVDEIPDLVVWVTEITKDKLVYEVEGEEGRHVMERKNIPPVYRKSGDNKQLLSSRQIDKDPEIKQVNLFYHGPLPDDKTTFFDRRQ